MSGVVADEDKFTFIVVFTILAIVNVVGNVLVIFVVWRFSFMHTPMNYMLVHLAICDILLAVFLLLVHVLNDAFEHPGGTGGDLLCSNFTTGTIAWLPASASINTLVAIAWERYTAIMKPHVPRFSNRKLKICLALCWVVSVMLNLPQRISYIYDEESKICVHRIVWIEKLDSIAWLVGAGVIPLLLMSALYGRVIFRLWSSDNNNGNIAQRSLLKSRKRITKSGMTVTAFFMFCWMPSLLHYTIVAYSNKHAYYSKNTTEFFWRYTVHALIVLNSTLNPFIYELPDKRFRRCLKDLFKRALNNKKRNRIHLQENGGRRSVAIAEIKENETM